MSEIDYNISYSIDGTRGKFRKYGDDAFNREVKSLYLISRFPIDIFFKMDNCKFIIKENDDKNMYIKDLVSEPGMYCSKYDLNFNQIRTFLQLCFDNEFYFHDYLQTELTESFVDSRRFVKVLDKKSIEELPIKEEFQKNFKETYAWESHFEYEKLKKKSSKMKMRYLADERLLQIYHPDMLSAKKRFLQKMFYITNDKNLKKFKHEEFSVNSSMWKRKPF